MGATADSTAADESNQTATDDSNKTERRDGTAVISDVGFVRLGGLLEVIAVALVIVSLAISIAAGLPQPNPETAAMGDWLTDVENAGTIYLLTSWLFVVDHLLELAFVVALFHLFREEGAIMRLAVVAGVIGLFMVALSGIIELGLVELADRYVATGEPAQSSLLGTAVALEYLRLVLNLVGTVLAWGVGGALFSLAIVRTEVLPRWLGWLGLAFGVTVWLNALQLVSSAFAPVILLMLLVGILWLPAMGLTLLRIDPSQVPASD